MQQAHLWYDEPLSRTTDPLSSHDGGKRVAVKASTQAGIILYLLKQQGCAMTAEQIAVLLDIDAYTVRKRLPNPLEASGLVTAINRDHVALGDVLHWIAVEVK